MKASAQTVFPVCHEHGGTVSCVDPCLAYDCGKGTCSSPKGAAVCSCPKSRQGLNCQIVVDCPESCIYRDPRRGGTSTKDTKFNGYCVKPYSNSDWGFEATDNMPDDILLFCTTTSGSVDPKGDWVDPRQDCGAVGDYAKCKY